MLVGHQIGNDGNLEKALVPERLIMNSKRVVYSSLTISMKMLLSLNKISKCSIKEKSTQISSFQAK